MDWNLDLLGDPIPEGLGKRGRPPHLPTVQNRSKVMLLLAVGWTEPRIAAALAVSKPTLKKHYFRELKAREEARDRATAAVFAACFEQVQKGNVGAIKEFGRMLDRADMMRIDFAKPASGEADPESLGKKAQAQRDAEEAHRTSQWGALVEPPPRPN